MASAYSKSAISASMSAMRALDGQKRKPCRRRRPPTQDKVKALLERIEDGKVREEIQSIFIQMGFEEMPTNNFVESSFWNFDALFQPQQHPAHDSHAPASRRYLPEDYVERVKLVLESGGYGSKGYGYDWKGKKLIRISFGHTTAVSTRILYMLAQQNQSLGNGTT